MLPLPGEAPTPRPWTRLPAAEPEGQDTLGRDRSPGQDNIMQYSGRRQASCGIMSPDQGPDDREEGRAMHRLMSRSHDGRGRVGAWGPLARRRRGWGWGLAVASLLGLSVPSVGLGAPGALDLTFGTGGIVTTDLGFYDGFSALVWQPDGKLVAAGSSTVSATSPSRFALARYQPDGSLDATFGTGGVVTTDLGGNHTIDALVLQPDGKLVAAGRYLGQIDSSILARYNPDGSLDPTFGTEGTVTPSLESGNAPAALILQPDGKLVLDTP